MKLNELVGDPNGVQTKNLTRTGISSIKALRLLNLVEIAIKEALSL